MPAGNAHKVIATAGLVSVGIGTANSIFKNHRLPSGKFLLGSGATFLILSLVAEGEPEVAKALAIAVSTTVVLGDGGGVLSYISPHGEINTQKPATGRDPRLNSPPTAVIPAAHPPAPHPAHTPRAVLPPYPGLAPTN